MSNLPTAAPKRPPRIRTVTVLALSIFGAGCAAGPHLVTPPVPSIPKAAGSIPAGNDAVLTSGNQIVANTAEGKLKIEAGPGLRRVFDWDGLRRGAIVQPRGKPFTGAMGKGLHFHGTPKVWADAKGITRLRYQEGKHNFKTVDDAMIWMQIRRLYYAYNDSGLVVGWKRQGNTLRVELWQFYIDGKQPTSLPDSENGKIDESKLTVVPQKMYPHLVFSDGHTEPYNTKTASKLHGSGASSQSNGSANKQNWFQRHITDPIKSVVGDDNSSG